MTEPLYPLGHPGDKSYSCHGHRDLCTNWYTTSPEWHIQHLYERCDALLAIIDDQQIRIERLEDKLNDQS